MSDLPPLTLDSMPPELVGVIDDQCDRFEEAWRVGLPAVLEAYLAEVSLAMRPLLLRELLALELTYRRTRHEHPQAEEYLQRFPEYATVVRAAFAVPAESLPQATPQLFMKWKMNWLLSQMMVPAESMETTAEPDAGEAELAAGHLSDTDSVTQAVSSPPPLMRELPMRRGHLEREYLLLGRLGRGGMGVVHKALERKTNRIVALKVIRPDRLEGVTELERLAWIESFRRVAVLTGKLEHQNIVPLYHVGEERGQFFYVMRYIEGRSLGQVVREDGPLSNERAARYMEDVARATHYAHSRGILHCDLKPRNVLLDANTDTVFLADFGLARPLNTSAESQSAIGPVGTYPYMAPEQAQGRPQFHPAGDVYGLGAALYDLVTGRPPFQSADSVETLRQVREDEPVPPRRLNPAVNRDLETIILTCLRKEPARRYVNAAALADDLANYRAGRPIMARPVSWLERAWRWCRRNPRQALAYSTAAFALLAITALSAYGMQMQRVAKAQKNALDEKAWREQEMMYEHGQEACERGDIALGLLTKVESLRRAPHHDGDLVSHTHRDMAAWSHRVHSLKAFLPHRGNLGAAAFTPDGKLAITGCNDGSIRVWDVATGTEQANGRLKHPTYINALAISSDGKLLAVAGGPAIGIWNLPQRTLIRTLGDERKGDVLAVAFQADGRLLSSVRAGGTIQRWDLESGITTATVVTEKTGPLAVAFSPDGGLVLLGMRTKVGDKYAAQLWDLATGRPHHGRPMLHDEPVRTAAFAPDGRTILTGTGVPRSGRGGVHVWSASSGDHLADIPITATAPVTGIALSPDGSRLFVSTSINFDESGDVQTWDLAVGRLVSRFPLIQGASVVAFSPDRSHFLSGGFEDVARLGGVQLWETALSPGPNEVVRFEESISGLALDAVGTTWAAASLDKTTIWHKNTGIRHTLNAPAFGVAMNATGDMVATVEENVVRLWNARTGEELDPLPPAPQKLVRVAFSSDSTLVVAGGSQGFCGWNVADRRLLYQQPGVRATAIGFGPTGAIVTGSAEGTIQTWDAATGALLHTPTRQDRHAGMVLSLAYSRDGKQLITGSTDATAQIWDTSTGRPKTAPLIHGGSVRTVAISPDGKLAATGSDNGMARLWDVATGKPVGPPLAHRLRVSTVVFSADGRSLLTAGDNVVRCWDLVPPGPAGDGDVHRRLEVQSGLELDERGGVRHMNIDTWSQRGLMIGPANGPAR